MPDWTDQDDAELRRIFAGQPPAPTQPAACMVQMSAAAYAMLIGANELLGAMVEQLRSDLAASRAANAELAAERAALVLERTRRIQ